MAMAVASRGRPEFPNHRNQRPDVSPERTKVWTEPTPKSGHRKVPVVYYLSKNGHLDHPHFIEIPLFDGEALYLRDFLDRLDSLRGKGIATLYSWSSKRSYKNGFVWHDLAENDFIYPSRGNEYVLMGSEVFGLDSPKKPQEIPNSEYRVFKINEPAAEAVDAWTQTDDKRLKRRDREAAAELAIDEISPPPSSSSPEVLEEGKRGRIRAPAALMQLISCGSISVKSRGLSLVAGIRGRLPRAAADQGEKEKEGGLKESCSGFSTVILEDKEYFSGSLVEMKRKGSGNDGEFRGLRRSSSCNEDRSLKMELAKEIERAKCIPRKLRVPASRKVGNPSISCDTNGSKQNTGEILQ